MENRIDSKLKSLSFTKIGRFVKHFRGACSNLSFVLLNLKPRLKGRGLNMPFCMGAIYLSEILVRARTKEDG
jgi:hypothetical protein